MAADSAATSAAPADERLAYRGPIQRLLTRPEIGGLVGAGAIWIFFWSVSDVFGTTAGANNYLDVATSLGIMAIAVALLMIGGEFDLSSGAMTGATGMLVVLLVKDTGELGGLGLPLTIAIPITFLFAMGIGWVNGTLVEKTGLPSFIVTLGTFFVLRGGKLGFSKLFVDKVIVEGLDDAPDYDFWSNIFGSVWIRNDHIWDSFLGGRDVVFGVLATLGVAALAVGLMELSMVRRTQGDKPSMGAGMILSIAGLAAAAAGLIALTATDGSAANWIWSIVMAAGVVASILGYCTWRFVPSSGSSSGLSMGRGIGRRTGIGLGLVVVGTVLGVAMDSSNDNVLGLLLTVQGLRAILFGGCVIVGVLLLLGVARDSGDSPVTRFAVTALAGVSVAAVGFVIQAEAASRKYRAEFFAWMMAAAVVLLVVAIVRMRFDQRRQPDAEADRMGTLVSIIGIVLIVMAVATKLLWATTSELEQSRALITYRISVLYFFAFAAVATWLLMRTKFGSWAFAVGGNKDASRQVGVPAARTKTQLFMTVSGASWLVGTLIAFRLNSVQANVGDGLEFFYIIAAVVGGNLLTGGYGSAAGAAIGALIMAMSFQGIPFAGWNSDWRFLFVGVILLLAVMVNNYVRGKAEKS
ncbi:ABC transporter permease [Candidatus Spongiisocius sp.]|uniref:ABC transporter permease n=1 Tax=Candidatus Spongiisocius sp. TaxID=3101273 RepID=UPI003B5A967D